MYNRTIIKMIKLDLKKLDLKLMDDVFEEFICENFSEKCKYFLSYFHGKSINSCHTRTRVYLCCIFGKGEENWKRLTYLWPRPLKISSMDLWTLLQFHHHHCSKMGTLVKFPVWLIYNHIVCCIEALCFQRPSRCRKQVFHDIEPQSKTTLRFAARLMSILIAPQHNLQLHLKSKRAKRHL